MFTILASDAFRGWLKRLRDVQGRARVLARIVGAENGHFGDSRPVGDGVMEMRIHAGPGYRIYYTRTGYTVYLLLVGGDKSSQTQDIRPGQAHGAGASGRKAMNEFRKFDAAEYLDSDEMIAAFLTAALEEDDPDTFIAALGTVARARGMAQIAKDAGVGRESLYKALAPGSKPRHETVRKVLRALGVKFTVSAA